RAPATHVGGDHLIQVVAPEGFIGLAEGGVGLLCGALAALDGRLGRWALFQLLDALSEAHEAEIVERGRSELLLLTGKGAFQRGLCLAEFARGKLAGAGVVELPRGVGRCWFGSGGSGGGAPGKER